MSVSSESERGATNEMPDPSVSATAVVTEIISELPDVATYHLAFADDRRRATYRFQPGQFNMLYIPGAGEIPISLSASPDSRNTWAHTVRAVGNVTQSLSRLRPGDTLGLRGPFGSSWPMKDCLNKDVLIIGGGIGLAPLRSAIYFLLRNRAQFGRISLLVGARSPASILYHGEFENWRRQGLSVDVTVDRATLSWPGNVGVVTQLVEQMRDLSPTNTLAMCCGPELMMRYVARELIGRGLSANQIWVSMERNMQCAVGLCGHCQLGPEFICKDGPVLRYDRVEALMKVEAL